MKAFANGINWFLSIFILLYIWVRFRFSDLYDTVTDSYRARYTKTNKNARHQTHEVEMLETAEFQLLGGLHKMNRGNKDAGQADIAKVAKQCNACLLNLN
jgi:hypothetical protein